MSSFDSTLDGLGVNRYNAASAAAALLAVEPARAMPRLSSVEFIAVEVMISGPA